MTDTQIEQAPQFAPLVIPGLGVVQPRVMTIASVHFEPRHRPDFHHSRHLKFELAAAPKGGYTTCSFCDSQQVVRDTTDVNSSETRGIPLPVPVDIIATSLMEAWSHAGVDPFGKARPKPGIMIIQGTQPTAEELAEMNAMEEKLCRYAVEEADRIKTTGKGEIGEFHRNALAWMGSERRDWFKPIERGLTKTSPATGEQINMNATVDNGVDLIEYYVKYGLKPEDYGDEHIATMFKRDPDLRRRVQERLGLRPQQQQAK
jgi:hypothetical protein